ncbi:unnamed protein product [Symbiodinium natans]|uniref:Uncharacterized protein n=1 Tax=Symbiodinium natans TaxID=878477 RepID=A0A812RV72_9DINO|nr:unnamed protein product [Symbiodinium natans]
MIRLVLFSLPALAATRWSLEEEQSLLAGLSFVQCSHLQQRGAAPPAKFGYELWDALSPCMSCRCSGTEHGQQLTWSQVLLQSPERPECVYNACERPRMFQLVRAPANAFSSLGFLAVGLFILSMAISDLLKATTGKDGPIPGPMIFHALVFGAAVVAEGLASFAYHASLTRQMNILDWRTMIASFAGQGFGMVVAGHALARQPVRGWIWATLYLACTLSLLLSLCFNCGCFCSLEDACHSPAAWSITLLASGLLCFSALAFVELTTWHCLQELRNGLELSIAARLARRRIRYFMWSSVAMWLVGYTFKVLDDHQVMCRPSSLFQLVGLMHVLTAAAMLLNFLATRTCVELLQLLGGGS